MQHWHLGNDCGLNWTSLRSPGASTGAHFRLSQTLLPSFFVRSFGLTDRPNWFALQRTTLYN